MGFSLSFLRQRTSLADMMADVFCLFAGVFISAIDHSFKVPFLNSGCGIRSTRCVVENLRVCVKRETNMCVAHTYNGSDGSEPDLPPERPGSTNAVTSRYRWSKVSAP